VDVNTVTGGEKEVEKAKKVPVSGPNYLGSYAMREGVLLIRSYVKQTTQVKQGKLFFLESGHRKENRTAKIGRAVWENYKGKTLRQYKGQ